MSSSPLLSPTYPSQTPIKLCSRPDEENREARLSVKCMQIKINTWLRRYQWPAMTVLFPSSTRRVSLDNEESNTFPSISLPWKQKVFKWISQVYYTGLVVPSHWHIWLLIMSGHVSSSQSLTGWTGVLPRCWELWLLTCCTAPSSPRESQAIFSHGR